MEKKEKDPIQTFDTLYTTNQIQIMKILLPFCDEQARRSLVVMIKFMELQYTISFTQKHPDAFHEAPLPFSLADVCEQIKAYCPPQLRSMLEQFQSMQSALKMYEDMKQMMELFQDSEGSGAGPFGSGDPTSMLLGFLSPEQQELFRMLSPGPGSPDTQAADEGTTDTDNPAQAAPS